MPKCDQIMLLVPIDATMEFGLYPVAKKNGLVPINAKKVFGLFPMPRYNLVSFRLVSVIRSWYRLPNKLGGVKKVEIRILNIFVILALTICSIKKKFFFFFRVQKRAFLSRVRVEGWEHE
jgi:hypothetical protein